MATMRQRLLEAARRVSRPLDWSESSSGLAGHGEEEEPALAQPTNSCRANLIERLKVRSAGDPHERNPTMILEIP